MTRDINETCVAGVAKEGRFIHFATKKGQRIWATLSDPSDRTMMNVKRWEKIGEKMGYKEYPLAAVKRRHMEPIGKKIWDHVQLAKDSNLGKTRKPKFTNPLEDILMPFHRYRMNSAL